MKGAADTVSLLSPSSLMESATHTSSIMTGAGCSSPSVTGIGTNTPSFNSPSAPRGTPRSPTNRCLVRSLLLQRVYKNSENMQQQRKQRTLAPLTHLTTSCINEREEGGDVNIFTTQNQGPMRHAASDGVLGTSDRHIAPQPQLENISETTVLSDDAENDALTIATKESDNACHRRSGDATASGDQRSVIRNHSDHHTVEESCGSTRDQEETIATLTTSKKSIPPHKGAVAGWCPSSRSSNVYPSTKPNSNPSSSLCGIPANAPRPIGANRSHAVTTPLSSSALSHITQSFNGNGNGGGGNTEPKAVPLMLRASLSAYPTREESCSPVTSSSVPRNLVVGASATTPQIPPGTLAPSGAASLGSVTPLSSGLSSAHPSFVRPPSVAPSSGASATRSGGDLGAANTPVGVGKTRGCDSNSGPVGGIAHTMKGRVLSSPQAARRPDLGIRRTTFQRSTSTFSLSEAASSRGAPPPSDVREEFSYASEEKPVASTRPQSTIPRDMHSFVLGQYRSLQRDVLSHPPSSPCVNINPTSVHVRHVSRKKCPVHSSEAKALLQKQEEMRLRALQQQHHDMEVIRNGGREQVSQNMKSSVALASSLSKLRARTRTTANSTPVSHSRDEFTNTSLEEEDAVQLQSPKRELEAWHASKAFMASNTPAGAPPPGRPSGNLRKNFMKGEEIVVALGLDSEDEQEDEDVDASNTAAERRRRPIDVGPSSDTAVAKCAGERLVSQPQRRRGTAASVKCVARCQNSGSDDDNVSSQDASLSYNKRHNRSAHHTPSFSPLSPSDWHHYSKACAALLIQSSGEGNENDDSDNVCCDCCPCKRPQNFFALCRTNSRSSSTFAMQGEQHHSVSGETDEHKKTTSRFAPEVASSKLGAEEKSGTATPSDNPNISFVMEDLEKSDEDEPMLSVQSFRRASIQRIR